MGEVRLIILVREDLSVFAKFEREDYSVAQIMALNTHLDMMKLATLEELSSISMLYKADTSENID